LKILLSTDIFGGIAPLLAYYDSKRGKQKQDEKLSASSNVEPVSLWRALPKAEGYQPMEVAQADMYK